MQESNEQKVLLSDYYFLLLHDRLDRVKQDVTAEAMLLDFPRVAFLLLFSQSKVAILG